MQALIDCANGEVLVRVPFTDPGALESAMQSHCGDGATPEEVAEMQSKLEWFTHFSARHLDQDLVLLGASRTQIRSVMATLKVEAVPESTEDCDGPVVTDSPDDCQPVKTATSTPGKTKSTQLPPRTPRVFRFRSRE